MKSGSARNGDFAIGRIFYHRLITQKRCCIKSFPLNWKGLHILKARLLLILTRLFPIIIIVNGVVFNIFMVLDRSPFLLQQNYLMKFGYLPQTDFETGNLRTEDQLRDAIKNLQVNKR
jgi:hypothetical protein